MSCEDNKRLCRRFIDNIFNQGEMTAIWDFVAADALNHEIDALGDARSVQGRSPAWMADLAYLYRRAFPDLHLEIGDQVAEGDQVVTNLRLTGTHRNPLMTIAASGQTVDVPGIRIDRIAQGKIVESWFHLDSLTLLRQIGALPPINRRPAVAMESADLQGVTLPALFPRHELQTGTIS
jgi:steroid delta-isomerase-like uncharacterized protein